MIRIRIKSGFNIYRHIAGLKFSLLYMLYSLHAGKSFCIITRVAFRYMSGDLEVTLPVYGNSNYIFEDSCRYIPATV